MKIIQDDEAGIVIVTSERMVPRTCSVLAVALTLAVAGLSWIIALHCHARLPAPLETQSSTRFVARNARVQSVLA